MKYLLIAFLLSFAAQNLFACDSSISFKCSSTYLLKTGEIVKGPKATEKPIGCEALIILDTAAGIYVAKYDQQTSSMAAWLSYQGEQAILVRSAPLNETNVLKNQLISPVLFGEVERVNIECKIRRDPTP